METFAQHGRIEEFLPKDVGQRESLAVLCKRRCERRVPVESAQVSGQCSVLDSDTLNAIADEPECLVKASAPAVITPHPGEMARLMGSDVAAVQADRLESAKAAAKQFDCVALLKGARSVIAAPQGQVRICPTGNPGMASGGTGDVLTGMVGAFLGQGMSPFDAASAGAYLHGLAGDLAAAATTEVALVAGDVLGATPLALRQALLAGGE